MSKLDELLIKNNPNKLTLEEQEKLRQLLRGLMNAPQGSNSINWEQIKNKPYWLNTPPVSTSSGIIGSGTTGRISEFYNNTLRNSTLIKSNSGLLTLSSSGNYTLTVPETGTAVLGSGVAGRLTAWADNNTVGASGGLTTAGDLIYMSADAGVIVDTDLYSASTLISWTSPEAVQYTFSLPGVSPTDKVRFEINIWGSAEDLGAILRIRKNDISGAIVATNTFTGATGTSGHIENWVATVEDLTPTTTYVLTAQVIRFGYFYSDYRNILASQVLIVVAPDRLPIGSEDQFLRVASGVPAWETIAVTTGSGTSGRIPQWTGSSSLGDSTLIKTGAGVLTLSAGADYTLTVAGTSSIAGTLSGGGTVATGGFTLTVPATGTAAMGAGTLTVTSTNNATIAAHTHAITSSSNPGAAARILASTSNGYLTLVRLGFGRSPQTQIDAISDAGVTFNGVTYNDTAATDTNYIFTRGRGTIATPAAVQNGDSLGSFQFKGYYDGTTISGSRGKIIVNAAENWSSTNQGTNLGFQVTPTGGSTTLATLFGIYGAGLVAVGSSIPTARFHVYGAADVVQEIVQAHSTQTANLVEWKSSAGAVQALITGTGGAVFNEAGDAAGDVRIEGDTEANMFFSDASADLLYLGGTTNGIKISKGGDLELIGTAKYERHVQIEASVNGNPADSPSLDDLFTATILVFTNTGSKHAHCQFEIPDDWDGTDIYIEVDTVYLTAQSGTATTKWDVEYRSLAEGEAMNNGTSVTLSVTDSADYGQYITKHQRLTLAFNNANQPLTVQDHVFFKIGRDNTVTNNFGGSVGVTAFEIIYNSKGFPASN